MVLVAGARTSLALPLAHHRRAGALGRFGREEAANVPVDEAREALHVEERLVRVG